MYKEIENMSISTDIEVNNIIERAKLLVKAEKLKYELSIIYDKIEGYTQFMCLEDIEKSNNLFNEYMEEEENE